MHRIRVIAAGILLAAASARADIVVLAPVQDNTLYSEDGGLSNGAGQHFLCGRAGTGGLRRGLLKFDLSTDIPAEATVYQISLTLNLSQTSTGPTAVALHRVLESWGEGTSDAAGGEGGGTAATPNDATWEHRFFDAALWTTVGGQFEPGPSDTQSVGGLAGYTWSSAGMIDDAQVWLASPESNHGWIMIGDESGPLSGKRFDSRQHPDPSLRPRLIVHFVLGCPGDVDGDQQVDIADLAQVLSQFGTWSDQCRAGCPEDFDDDGDVDLSDLAFLLTRFGSAC